MRWKMSHLATVLLFCISTLCSLSLARQPEFRKFYLEFGQKDTPGWGWVRPGDMDGDGDIDLVAGGGRRLFVYTNDGKARGWVAHGSLDPTEEIGSNGCILYDVDRDGDLDVVSARYKSDPGWWENPGDRLFEETWEFHALDNNLDGWYVHDILLADLDGDGKKDEFVFNFNKGYWEATTRIYWYRPGSDPHDKWEKFVIAHDMPEQNHGHAGLDAADLDGDSHVDLVFSNGWFKAPPHPDEGGWTWRHICPVYGISNSLAVDIDRDGMLDLVMAAGHHGKGIYWYRNEGNAAGWSLVTIDSTIVHPEGMQVLDFDNDGWSDILAAELFFGEEPGEPDWSDEAHGIYLFRNTGGTIPGWEKIVISSDSYPAHGILISDVNLDGIPDLIGNGCGYSVISYYEGLNSSTGN
ncbi:FG-GAP repeat domain-containing protein [Gemmatimonadota bacterium]